MQIKNTVFLITGPQVKKLQVWGKHNISYVSTMQHIHIFMRQ